MAIEMIFVLWQQVAKSPQTPEMSSNHCKASTCYETIMGFRVRVYLYPILEFQKYPRLGFVDRMQICLLIVQIEWWNICENAMAI